MKHRISFTCLALVSLPVLSGCMDVVAPMAAGAAGRVVATDQMEKADLAWAEKAKTMSCAQLNAERKKYRNLKAGIGYGYSREYGAEALMQNKGCSFS